MPYLDELRERLRLRAFDIIDERWYDDLVNYLALIEGAGALDYEGYLHSNIIPDTDALYNVGVRDRRLLSGYFVYGYFSEVHAEWGYFSENVYVQGKRVLKDEDPIYLADIFPPARRKIRNAVRDALFIWSQPPLLLDDRTLATTHRIEERIEDGKTFRGSFRYDDLPNGASTNLLIENPVGSGVVINIYTADLISQGQGALDIYKNVTVTNYGTPIPTTNLNFGFPDDHKAVVSRDITYTGGKNIGQLAVLGGYFRYIAGGLLAVGEKIILTEGTNLLIVFQNRSSNTIDVSFRILWWEDPVA